MNHSKPILTILLFSWTLISFAQTESKEELDENVYGKNIPDSTNKLTGKIETLEINYTVWGCACPNWIRTIDVEQRDTNRTYISYHFYIEPSNKKLKLPKYFDPFQHSIKIVGEFYGKENYPQGLRETEEQMPKAKVFRYTKMEVINRKKEVR